MIVERQEIEKMSIFNPEVVIVWRSVDHQHPVKPGPAGDTPKSAQNRNQQTLWKVVRPDNIGVLLRPI